jgi:hypothetical protein
MKLGCDTDTSPTHHGTLVRFTPNRKHCQGPWTLDNYIIMLFPLSKFGFYPISLPQARVSIPPLLTTDRCALALSFLSVRSTLLFRSWLPTLNISSTDNLVKISLSYATLSSLGDHFLWSSIPCDTHRFTLVESYTLDYIFTLKRPVTIHYYLAWLPHIQYLLLIRY